MTRISRSHLISPWSLSVLAGLWGAFACSNDGRVDSGGRDAGDSGADADADAADAADSGSDIGADIGLDVGDGGAGGGGQQVQIVTELPDGFTPATGRDSDAYPAAGGFHRVGLLEDVDSAPTACANILRAVSRDFVEAHVDFGSEKPDGPNFVELDLGADRKPVLNAAMQATSDIAAFGDWYNNEAVNQQYVVDLWLEPEGAGYVFSSGMYFPLDGVGDETHDGHDDLPHNFLFTTELHTQFKFAGDETFTFTGDDDVWVFVNGKLGVDLGGIHGVLEHTIDLGADAADFGLEVGKVYPLDLFHAERNPSGSNFRIETTLDFSGCSEILPIDVK